MRASSQIVEATWVMLNEYKTFTNLSKIPTRKNIIGDKDVFTIDQKFIIYSK